MSEAPRADNFEMALLYVVRSLGQVNVTKLEKILYLSDLEHFHQTGATLTGARWVRYKLGPLAKRLIPARNEMVGHELRVSDEEQGDRHAQVYRPGPAPRFVPRFEPSAKRDLERIVAMTRSMNSDEIIRLAYNTTPMRFLLAKENGTPRYNVSIPFDLDLGVVARSATEKSVLDHEARREFKRRELDRIADLTETALTSSQP